MDFLKKMREAVRACSNLDWQWRGKQAADELDAVLTQFIVNPTEQGLKDLNAAWAKANRVFTLLPPEATPDPVGGSTHAPLLQMAA